MSIRDRLKNKLTIVTQLLDEREKYMAGMGVEDDDSGFSESDFPTPLFIGNVAVHLPDLSLKQINEKRKVMSLDDMVLHFEKQNPRIMETAVFVPKE